MPTTDAATALKNDDLYRDIKVIDVDTHLSEPLDLWTSRATPKYRDRVPQMKVTDGKLVWTIDGDISLGLGAASSVVHSSGRKAEGYEFTKWIVTDVHPSCSQAKARLEVMDECGVWAQVIYPNVLGFAGQGRMKAADKPVRLIDDDLRLVSTQIYNDAGAELQADSGGRLMPMALLPWWSRRPSAAGPWACAA